MRSSWSSATTPPLEGGSSCAARGDVKASEMERMKATEQDCRRTDPAGEGEAGRELSREGYVIAVHPPAESPGKQRENQGAGSTDTAPCSQPRACSRPLRPRRGTVRWFARRTPRADRRRAPRIPERPEAERIELPGPALPNAPARPNPSRAGQKLRNGRRYRPVWRQRPDDWCREWSRRTRRPGPADWASGRGALRQYRGGGTRWQRRDHQGSRHPFPQPLWSGWYPACV